MELGGIACAADAVTLHRNSRVCGQMHSPFGQGESVGVPLKDRKPRGQMTQHRIGAALVCQMDMDAAMFGMSADVVHRPRAARKDLAAKANAQHSRSRQGGIMHQAGKIGQIRVAVIGKRVLLAAKGHQRIKAANAWQFAIQPRAKKVDGGGGFVQGHADLAVMGDGGIFNDRDAHEGPMVLAAVCTA